MHKGKQHCQNVGAPSFRENVKAIESYYFGIVWGKEKRTKTGNNIIVFISLNTVVTG